MGAGILGFFFVYPLLVFIFLWYYQDNLREVWFVMKYGAFTSDINIRRNPNAKYFHVLFFYRRFILVIIPLVLRNMSSTTLYWLVIIQIFYIIILGNVFEFPQDSLKSRVIESMNEVFLFIFIYHLLMLTDLSYNVAHGSPKLANTVQDLTSYSFLGFIGLAFAINITLNIYLTISDCRKTCRL